MLHFSKKLFISSMFKFTKHQVINVISLIKKKLFKKSLLLLLLQSFTLMTVIRGPLIFSGEFLVFLILNILVLVILNLLVNI